MSDHRLEIAGTTRRRALAAGAGAVGAVGTAAVLAACGTDDPGYDPYVPVDEDTVGTSPSAPASPTGSASPGAGDGEGGNPDALASTEDVPVGGGLVLADQDTVITQPTQGEWRGFSATCTHQGCTVAGVDSGTINCNCHGSRFSIEDGSVVNAAAGLTPENQDPLPEKQVNVRDGQVFLA
jgi:Rieske Fe-S protein